jgi:AhpD family alkylhydroperoxidase
MRIFAKTLATAMFLLGSASLAQAAAPASGRAAKSSPAADATRAEIGKTLGFVPQFFLDVPDVALPGTWDQMKTLQLNPNTALQPRVKELIGLAVSSQIPCRYCIYAHSEFAKLNGAERAELGEAVTMAALTRHWSTYLNGTQTDETKFRAEIAKIIENVKKAAASKAPAPRPLPIVDGAGALADVSQTLGFAPDFLKRYPDAGRAGAWRSMKEVQMNPNTAVSPKNKELIGLAVASQVPCKYCVVAHTEFARLAGASDAEINEAIAMASVTRHMSTLLNGLQVDEPQFRRDVDRLVKGAQAAARKSKRTTETAAR